MDEIVAAVIVKVAYLVSGLVICFIGKSLLEKGITADFHGEGEIASRKLRIVTSSPGIIFLLAGLAVLIVGIRHDTSVGADGVVRLGQATFTDDQLDPAVLIERMRVVNRDAPQEENTRANAYFDQAVRCERREADANCLELLLKATALDPNLIVQVQESPIQQKRLNDPMFRAYATARMRIYLQQAAALQPLSNNATGLLARLSFLVSQWPSSKTSNEGIGTAETRLGIGVVDPRLIEALVTILNSNPKALLYMLKKHDNAWALENEEIQLALSKALDGVSLNLFTPPQEAEQ